LETFTYKLIALMKECAGEFSEGMLQKWTSPRIVNRVREKQVRLGEVTGQHSDVDNLEINTYREFQWLKLKAIQLFLKEYEKILANVREDAAVLKMLKVVNFLSQEKLKLAASMGFSAI
jgi:hypothetical protein